MCIFDEFVGKDVTLFLKSGIRFSGKLLRIEGKFLKLDDRFSGNKVIAIDSIENIERWKR